MRAFDPTPLFRASVGFDRMADLMDRVLAAEPVQPSYPPYNIEKTDENTYRISLAVAGFSADELAVDVKENSLVIAARKAEDEAGRTFLHRGIAARQFQRSFVLADGVEIGAATIENGLLHIDLALVRPESVVQTIQIRKG